MVGAPDKADRFSDVPISVNRNRGYFLLTRRVHAIPRIAGRSFLYLAVGDT